MRPLLASVLWMGVASCDSPSDPRPGVAITLTPPGPVPLNVGDTLTVRATVTNAETPGVRFSSSAPAVARVDETTGLVEALTAGDATVTATTVQTPSATATVQLRVQDRPSSVLIEQVRDADGQLVDPASVSGTIHVQLQVEVGSADRLQVLVDSTVVCDQGDLRGTVVAAAQLVCTFNTAGFDAATGTANFLNGSVRLGARLVGADGRVRHQTSGLPITLANPNLVVTQVFADDEAEDAAGLTWHDGDVRVTALPVMFDRGVSLTRAEFSYRTPSGTLHVRTDDGPPFTATFEETALGGVDHAEFQVAVRTVTSAGEPGPSGVTSPFQYDNRPPLPGTVRAREWVGATVTFASTFSPPESGDGNGVGGVEATFYVGDPVLGDSAIVARGTEVEDGSDLPPGGAGAYKVAVRVCDALENCVIQSGFRFGVDVNAPTVEEVGIRDRVINPTGSLAIRLRDDLSGFDATPVEAIVTSLDADAGTSTCGPFVDGLDLPGRLVESTCVADPAATQIPFPTTAAGYYTYSLTPLDRAGNRAETVVRRILRDSRAPSVTGVVVPTQGLPGDEVAFAASATDGLDLTDLVFRLGYPASGIFPRATIPFDTASTQVGAAFDATLTPQATRNPRFPIARTLTTVAGSNRATVLVDSVHVEAVDAAGLTDVASRAIPPNAYGGSQSTADPYPDVTGVAFSVAPVTVCSSGCQSGEPSTAGLELRITGPGSLRQQFARVYFYRRDLATLRVTLLGSVSGAFAQGDIGSQAVWRYSFTFNARGAPAGTYQLFAVGVSSAGNALRSEEKQLEIIER